jgi:hypothetical protein
MNKTKIKNAQQKATSAVTAGVPEDGENLTRITAHHMFEERGRQPGRDLEDWLAAEKYLAEKPVIDRKGEKALKSNLKIG